ncbi:hypothetical protein N7G274_002461 [Stereocaulon virgatum]|uniref:Uncharacterized protein n=1 Tax=Stereocaulon virgatum TaxID=373712 RepID=A0ABR4AJ51_9LECA
MDVEEERPFSIHLKRTHKRPGFHVDGSVVPHMSRAKTVYVENFTFKLVGRIHLRGGKYSALNNVGDEDTFIFPNLEAPPEKHPVRLQDWRVCFFPFFMPEEPGIEDPGIRQ